MITGRRPQEFHELVEGLSTSGAHATTLAPFLDLVAALRAVPDPVADPAFVAGLRERLVAEAASVLVPHTRSEVDQRLRLPTSTPQARRRHRRLAAAVGGVALVGAAATMSYAAQTALPGQELYPLKRTIESAHAELTFDQADQGRVLLDNASTRLDEVTQLSARNADPALIADTLDAFTTEAVSGSDLLVDDFQSGGPESSITTVRTFTAKSMTRLHDLQGQLPSGSSGQLLHAAQALDQIEQVSVHTCSGCAGPLVTEVPTVLTQAMHATGGTPGPGSGQHGPGHHTANGQLHGPALPNLGGALPPGSVTDPGTIDDSGTATAQDVQSTLDNLTGNLTSGQQDSTVTTVGNTTGNLLDAVGQTGNTVTNTVGNVVSQVTSLLPTNLPTSVPTSLPTNVPTSVPPVLPSLP